MISKRLNRKLGKSKFKFKKDYYVHFYFCPHDRPGMLKQEGTAYCLKEFGYHVYFLGAFIVFHIPSGIPIQSFDNEKEARIKAKRLEAGLDPFDSFDHTIRDHLNTVDDIPF